MASLFTHVTVVPAAILRSAGMKARLPRNSAPIGIVMDDDGAPGGGVADGVGDGEVTKKSRVVAARDREEQDCRYNSETPWKTSDPPMCLISGRSRIFRMSGRTFAPSRHGATVKARLWINRFRLCSGQETDTTSQPTNTEAGAQEGRARLAPRAGRGKTPHASGRPRREKERRAASDLFRAPARVPGRVQGCGRARSGRSRRGSRPARSL